MEFNKKIRLKRDVSRILRFFEKVDRSMEADDRWAADSKKYKRGDKDGDDSFRESPWTVRQETIPISFC